MGRGTVQQGHGFARLMTVSARFRVKSDPAGLVDHILNIFVVETPIKVDLLRLIVYIYIFLIYYTRYIFASAQVHLPENRK